MKDRILRLPSFLLTFHILTHPVAANTSFPSEVLGQAEWSWTTGGDAIWSVDEESSLSSGPAARAGNLDDNQEAWLETTIEGPGQIEFTWRTSSEWHGDFLTVSVNGKPTLRASGETEWETRQLDLDPGTSHLRWTFAKNDSRSVGEDSAWLAEVRWEPLVDYLLLAPEGQQLPAGGGSYQIQLFSDRNWSVDSFPAWLQIFPESGDGNLLLSVEVSPNPGITARSAAVSISGSKHSITQAAASDARFSTRILESGSAGTVLRFPGEPGVRYSAEFSNDLRAWESTTFQLAGSASPQSVLNATQHDEFEITANRPDETESASREFWRIHARTPPPGYAAIPAGPFVMGDTHAETEFLMAESSPAHTVETDSFFISPRPVSFAEWREVVAWALKNGYDFDHSGQRGSDGGGNELPESGETAKHPVVALSWHDAVKWCNAKSEMSGAVPAYYTDADHNVIYRSGRIDLFDENVRWNAPGYRLPREAEWEKAARGGLVQKRWPWGDDPVTTDRANYLPEEEAPAGTSLPGSYPKNGYGLEDVAGNVWEWNWDRHASSTYRHRAESGSTSPHGPDRGTQRVARGGSWDSSAEFTRVSVRLGIRPETALPVLGFRPAFGNGQE